MIVVAVVVVAVLVTFVLPQFSTLYSAFGAKLPTMARVMMDSSAWLKRYGLYLIMGAAFIGGLVIRSIQNAEGKVPDGQGHAAHACHRPHYQFE